MNRIEYKGYTITVLKIKTGEYRWRVRGYGINYEHSRRRAIREAKAAIRWWIAYQKKSKAA